jgi:hypothetical protein
MVCPSVAEPHCRPPVTPPGAACRAHIGLPSLARKAQNMPLFWPAPTRPTSASLPVSENSIGPCAKSQSGPAVAGLPLGQLSNTPENGKPKGPTTKPGVVRPQATFHAS